MSTAEELLNGLDGESLVEKEHVVVDADRFIHVPDSLKKLGIELDHNVNTIPFDCPRYWDGHDLSEMKMFINYMRADGKIGMYLATDVSVDESDENIIHFSWTISDNVTAAAGSISFILCAKKTNADGSLIRHWNSELNTDFFVNEGLDADNKVSSEHSDVIGRTLMRLDEINKALLMLDSDVQEIEGGYRITWSQAGEQSITFDIHHGRNFKYEDFTPEQLEAIRGPQGIQGEQGPVGPTGPEGPTGPLATLRDLLGTAAIGSATRPVYYNGTKFVATNGSTGATLQSLSWAQINAIAESGTAADSFYIGETKTLKLISGESVTFVILGFDHDDLADGTGKAKITFGMEQLIDGGSSFNDCSEIKNTVDYLYAKLPADVKPFIKNVNKIFSDGTLARKAFLFSESEVGIDGYDNGVLYPYYESIGSLIKYLNTTASFWILRDTGAAVNSIGARFAPVSADALREGGLCFGFCI